MCNLFYVTMEFNSYMCCMQLKINCIRQLQNDNFLLVNINYRNCIPFNKIHCHTLFCLCYKNKRDFFCLYAFVV